MLALLLAVLVAVHQAQAFLPTAQLLRRTGSAECLSQTSAQRVASVASPSAVYLTTASLDSSCSGDAQLQPLSRPSTRRNVLKLLPLLATASYTAVVHAAESSADEFDVQFDGALGLELDNISYKGSKRLVGLDLSTSLVAQCCS